MILKRLLKLFVDIDDTRLSANAVGSSRQSVEKKVKEYKPPFPGGTFVYPDAWYKNWNKNLLDEGWTKKELKQGWRYKK